MATMESWKVQSLYWWWCVWGVGTHSVKTLLLYSKGKMDLMTTISCHNAFKLYPDSVSFMLLRKRSRKKRVISGFLQCVDSDLEAFYVKCY